MRSSQGAHARTQSNARKSVLRLRHFRRKAARDSSTFFGVFLSPERHWRGMGDADGFSTVLAASFPLLDHSINGVISAHGPRA